MRVLVEAKWGEDAGEEKGETRGPCRENFLGDRSGEDNNPAVVDQELLAYEVDQAGRELVPGAQHAGEPEPPGRPVTQDRIGVEPAVVAGTPGHEAGKEAAARAVEAVAPATGAVLC
jgi:hypothetical protein